MAVTSTPIYPQSPQAKAYQLTHTTDLSLETLYAAGANGSQIEGINVSNTDTSAYTLQLYAYDGTTAHLLGSFNIPASSGNLSADAAVALLGPNSAGALAGLPYDVNGNQIIYLPSGWSLQVGVTSQITSGKVVDCVAFGGDF